MMHRYLLPSLTLVALLGCPGPNPSTDRLPRLQAVEAFRAGSLDGEVAFDEIRSMAFGDDGSMYVLEVDRVTALSPEGDVSARFGRQGAGPGEFLQPTALGRLADTIWVHDGANHRFSLFSARGDLFDVVSPAIWPASSDGDFPPRPYFMFAGRHLLASMGVPAHLVAMGVVDSVSYFALDAEGGVVRELFRRPPTQPLWIRNPDSDNPYSGRITDQPFIAPALVRGSSSDRSVVAAEVRDSGVTLLKVNLGGDTAWARYLPIAARPVTDADVDSVIRDKAESFVTSPAAEGASILAVRSWIGDALIIPSHWSTIRDMHVGADGAIWVQLPGGEGSAEWIVVGGGSEVVGQVHLPEGVDVHAVSLHNVAGVLRDELDVPYVVSYRISP
jgi:hypothetical protein